MQDRQGFLWFATEGGLNQYDGYQFTVYQHDTDNPGSLSANLIFTFFEDRDGILWIGTSAGLDRLIRSSGIFSHYPKDLTGSDSLNGIPVTAINQDQSGTLWVGTNGSGLNALDLTTNRITEYRHHPEDPRSLSNDFEQLKKAVYDHTFDVCNSLVAQGTPPDMVQIGNEINAGILWPDGKYDHMDNLAALLKKATRL